MTPDSAKLVVADGKLVWKLKCPACRCWGYLSDDQAYGQQVAICGVPGCEFQATVNVLDLMDFARATRR